MAQVTSQEAGRIMSHMNKEHSTSLSHYLEFFGGIDPPANAPPPTITSFTTPEMEIEYGPEGKRKKYALKFDPPMWAGQARTRLEAMHSEARRGLGYSEAVVNTFDPSIGIAIGVALMVALHIVIPMIPAVSIARTLHPGLVKLIGDTIGLVRPPTMFDVGNVVKVLVLVAADLVHYLEAVFVTKPLLKKYNTTDPSAQRKWFYCTVLCGFPTHARFRRMAGKAEKLLEKKAGPAGH